MKVITVCEFSGIVREAFFYEGHDARSNDLLDTEIPGPHIKGDCRLIDFTVYDLMIAFPECRYLTKAGAGNFWNTHRKEQLEAINFVKWLWSRPVPRICIENPAGILSTVWKEPDQYIDPDKFGDPFKKHTGLYLKNLPPLLYTCIRTDSKSFIQNVPDKKDRWKIRSRFFPGVASAMAKQWGSLPILPDSYRLPID